MAETFLHRPQERYFRERVPQRLGLVSLGDGVSIVAFVHQDVDRAPCEVRLQTAIDRASQAVLVAIPVEKPAALSDDPKLRDMTCDPTERKILVTDGMSATGQAIVHALAGAGAERIWAGAANLDSSAPGLSALHAIPQVTLVRLDVTNAHSVRDLATELGAGIDIVVNSVDYRCGDAKETELEAARAEINQNYLGLLHLARTFCPMLKARAAAGHMGAWVNLLSVFALSSDPDYATYCASKAAAFSLAQAMRSDMAASGVRVINVFPGPIDEDVNRHISTPKITPKAVAGAIVSGLKGSVEDIYPGEIAQDWVARYLENPKALEREVAQGARR